MTSSYKVQVPQLIHCDQMWTVANELGSGGFGKVYLAHDGDGAEAVVKLIPKDPGAERELLFEELKEVPNVVPILARGEWGNYWIIVMPRADKSLRDYLRENIEHLSVNDTIKVLVDVTAALVAMENRIVHRDIKPENILLLQGHWCLADFGISRYAEATTATDTHKFKMTPPYAAPEQWREEQATSATDVYALGVVAYELLAGQPPFSGTAVHDYRRQHLEENPASIPNIAPRLQSMIDECLYKSPQARPSPPNLLERLKAILKPTSEAGSKLQQANAIVVRQQAEKARQQSLERSEEERRMRLLEAAEEALGHMANLLDSQIMENAPNTKRAGPVPEWKWHLNEASLHLIQSVFVTREECEQFIRSNTPPPFDVVAYSAIFLHVPPTRPGYEGRGHALWYCDAQEPGLYRWYETAFMITSSSESNIVPFGLAPGKEAYGALGGLTRRYIVARPFTPIDQGAESEFVDRWIGWFGEGAQGKLSPPMRIPELDPTGSWRR